MQIFKYMFDRNLNNSFYYDGLPPISEYIKKYNLNPIKSLGQNFILNLDITDKIAKSIPDIKDSTIIEIGSGPAGLTRALLYNNAKKVIAIEYDKRAIDILQELKLVYKDKLEIINADALQINLQEIKQKFAKEDSLKICANLPYNISIPLTIKALYNSDIIDSMILMYQLEVGERITAKPKTKNYGRISVMSQLNYNTKILFKVPKTCFIPEPKITSCIVSFTKQKNYIPLNELKNIENLVKLLFNERRKMIRSTLKTLLKNSDDMLATLKKLNIKETARAEEITPIQFYELSKFINT